MNYASIKKYDIANGLGVRVSLFVSGCTHHCEGCFNSNTWDFNFGNEFTSDTQREVIQALDHEYIAGLTLIGGEPMEPVNQRGLIHLVREVKEKFPRKNIWCYTGYTFETDLLVESPVRCEYTDELLRSIDVLVDGKFIISKKNLMLKFRGSENQRIILCKESVDKGCTILSELN